MSKVRLSKVEAPAQADKPQYRTSEAQRRATKKFNDKSASVSIRISHEQKDEWDAHVQARGESLRAFILRSVSEQMERDRRSR